MPRGTTRRSTIFAQQGGTKVHVIDPNPATFHLARCKAELHGPEYLARLVPPDERCQAPGCRNAWPAPLRAVS